MNETTKEPDAPATTEATTQPEAPPEDFSSLPYMSPTVGKLFAALSAAQGSMQAAIKNATNPHYKSKFADLDAVWESIRGPLSANGLCITQLLQPSPKGTVLVTILGHSSGEWARAEVPVRPEKPGIHAIASAIQYMRRYSIGPIAGATSAEDDDGNEAMKK